MPDEKNKIDFEAVNAHLLEANRECLHRTRPLIEMLGTCRQQFTLYAESHRAKDTEEGNQKAMVNEGMVKQINDVLAGFRDRESDPEKDDGPTSA